MAHPLPRHLPGTGAAANNLPRELPRHVFTGVASVNVPVVTAAKLFAAANVPASSFCPDKCPGKIFLPGQTTWDNTDSNTAP